MRTIHSRLLLFVLCAIASIVHSDEAKQMRYGAWGLDLSALDPSVDPGQDFYMYANGNWIKSAIIPEAHAFTGPFQDLTALTDQRLDAILRELANTTYERLSNEERKLRDFYTAFIDAAQIEARGLGPARKDLAYLARLATKKDVARAMGDPRLGVDGVFLMAIRPDSDHPDAYALMLTQGGLGLPNRDYYLRNDEISAAVRKAYKSHIAHLLELVGLSGYIPRANAVYALEARIAQAQWPDAARRDESLINNSMRVSQLSALAPQFPWQAFFAPGDVLLRRGGAERVVIVAEKSAFPRLSVIFAETPISVWRDYLRIRYLDTFYAYLPKRIDDAHFAFYGTVLGGNTQPLSRAARAGHILNRKMGEALGKAYIDRYFSAESRAKALDLVNHLLEAFDTDIRGLSWMSPETKEQALNKLHHMGVKMGYPDHWRDYSKLTIVDNDLIADAHNLDEFEWNRALSRLDDPADKSEWLLPPQIVDAYYDPARNEIALPAAILQPPLFDSHADDAVNYGGIGALLGHEISHGFDDQGSKYDSAGRLRNWWTPEDRKRFDDRASLLVKQYDAYEPLPGLFINGAATIGENIADNAGLAIALKAYHIFLDRRECPVLDGFSGDQRFYLSFAQMWREKMRAEAMRQQVLANPHSPPQFRVNGTTRNQSNWYSAFGVKAGTQYFLPPSQREHLW